MVLCLVLFAAVSAVAQDEVIIRDIVVEGGVTLTVDTVSYYLGLEPEDPLDIEYVIDGYRRLWESGLFEDVVVEVEDRSDGTVTLYVVVKERPFVTSVDLRGQQEDQDLRPQRQARRAWCRGSPQRSSADGAAVADRNRHQRGLRC